MLRAFRPADARAAHSIFVTSIPRAPVMSSYAPILGRMKDALGYAVLIIGGVIVASVGAVAHRAYPWLGVALCVAMVALAAAFARTWLSWSGLGLFAGAWMTMTFVWALEGPGGSVLIVQDRLGVGWLVGGALAVVVAALLPSTLLVGARGTR